MLPKIPEKLLNFQHLIEKLYNDDDTFKAVYEDYLTCLDAFEFWAQSNLDNASARRNEYAELVAELEEELTQIMNEGDCEKTID